MIFSISWFTKFDDQMIAIGNTPTIISVARMLEEKKVDFTVSAVHNSLPLPQSSFGLYGLSHWKD